MRAPVAAALMLMVSAAPVAARAEPVPYLQKPRVSFRTLPYVADPHPLNPYIHYVGAYEMTATGTSEFMGLSDIQVFPAGDHLNVEAISDWGAGVVFELRPQGDGYADSSLEIDPLRGADGQTFGDKAMGDSEDIAYDPATMDRYVSFEGHQRIMKYPAATAWRGRGETLPVSGLPVFPDNFGMEGLTYIRDKAEGDNLLVGVESGGFWDCDLKAYDCIRVEGPPVPGFLYMMTSLAVLDYASATTDHQILGLYRYYDPITGPRNILSLLRLEGDRAHGFRLVRVGDLLKVAPPMPYDNYEGVAAVKIDGGYRLYLICDRIHDEGKPKILVYDWKQP